jgi:hypothetical protein
MCGYRAIMAQGWQIVDRYKNTTREDMPKDETITSFADRLIERAEAVIRERGGDRLIFDGRPMFRIRLEEPANVRPLPDPWEQAAEMKAALAAEISGAIRHPKNEQELARSAYLAICLDLAAELSSQQPANWQRAIEALSSYWKIVQNIYFAPDTVAAERLRSKATAAGLKKPAKQRPVW